VIPPRITSPQVHCDFALYCELNLVERFFLENQTLQAHRDTLRTNPAGIPLYAGRGKRIHLDIMNVNAL
jgi:hypothetical protein